MPQELSKEAKLAMLGCAAILLLVLFVELVQPFSTSFGLSALAMGCMVVLLWSLVVFAALMNVVGLSDKTQALGLPEGSIRAIIALALVALFAVLASTVMTGHTVTLSEAANLETLKTIRDENKTLSLIIKPNPRTEPQTFTVSTPSAPADDFMKQMLTLVGTLMTAITAFYFGGRTATPSDPTRAPPKLTAVIDSPIEPSREPTMIKLSGADLNNVKSVSLFNGKTQRIAQGVLSNSSQVHALVAFSDEDRTDEKTWSVSVTDDIGRVATLENALTTKPKTPPPGG